MLSIITPVLNEEENIAPFIRHLKDFQSDFELIIVDGGSTDGTAAEIERCMPECSYPVRYLLTEQGRAVQMNAGAWEAGGSVLLFLHVDCRIPPDSGERIIDCLRDPAVAGGGFYHMFDEPDPLLRFSSACGNLMSRTCGTFFGDFGIFVRKDVFLRMGGFNLLPFCEDIEFCRRAKKFGKLARLDRCIISSSRRYAAIGKYRLTGIFILVLLLNAAGLRPEYLKRYIVGK
jgi:rSAM/selenodomain-associated transferase 2